MLRSRSRTFFCFNVSHLFCEYWWYFDVDIWSVIYYVDNHIHYIQSFLQNWLLTLWNKIPLGRLVTDSHSVGQEIALTIHERAQCSYEHATGPYHETDTVYILTYVLQRINFNIILDLGKPRTRNTAWTPNVKIARGSTSIHSRIWRREETHGNIDVLPRAVWWFPPIDNCLMMASQSRNM
jgi:hypothetical protein